MEKKNPIFISLDYFSHFPLPFVRMWFLVFSLSQLLLWWIFEKKPKHIFLPTSFLQLSILLGKCCFARENCALLIYMFVEREKEREKEREERKKTLLPAFSISQDSFFSCVQAILKSQPTTISSLLTVLILFKLLLLVISSFISFFLYICKECPTIFSSVFSWICRFLFWVLIYSSCSSPSKAWKLFWVWILVVCSCGFVLICLSVR